MNAEENENQAGVERDPAAGRRSTRVTVAIPIAISGRDTAGQAFKENTRTVVINKHGARILTFHELALGTEVKVENRSLGRVTKATVVWLGERRGPRQNSEVGVQLVAASNIWGYEFPPADWQEGPPMGEGGKRLEQMPSPLPEVLMNKSPQTDVPAAVGGSISPLAAAFEEIIAAQVRALEQRLMHVSGQISTQTQSAIHQAAEIAQKEFSDNLAKRVAEASDQWRALADKMDAAVAKLRSAAEQFETQTEKAQREVQSAISRKVESALETFEGKTAEAGQKAAKHAAEEAGNHAEQSASAAVSSQIKSLESQLHTLREDFETRVSKAAAARSDEFEAKIEEAAKSRQGELRSHADSLFDELLAGVEKKVQQDFMTTTLADLNAQAREAMQAASARVREDVGALQKASLETAKKQLTALIKSTVDVLNKEATAGIEEFRKQLGKNSKDRPASTPR